MKFHDVTMVGPFTNEKLATLPIFNMGTDPGRLVWLVDGTLWYGTVERWSLIGNIYNVDIYTYVTQPSHGFSTLQVIRHNDVQWVRAIANDVNTCATHVVGYVLDPDTFLAIQSGRFDAPSHGLIPGEYYFTSDISAGNITSVEPSSISNPMIFVEDSTYISVLPYRPCKYE